MNLLLASVDSLRADAVSRASPQVRTPRFDQVAAGFSWCDRCFSVSSATRPVHATLFTGLYPFEHGVVGQHHARVRDGVDHLFALAAARGWRVGAFSEAPDVFTGLRVSPWLQPCSPGDRQPIEEFVRRAGGGPCLVFAHFWGAHTPYGAADGRAWGETWELLRAGQVAAVRQRYARAVERLFEHQLAPLLEGLDLRRWAVLILGDHGQSWTAAEPYHGRSLDNAVLRVPLYLHVPGSGNPPLPRRMASLVDVFPTVAALLELPTVYQGYGGDLRRPGGDAPYLAEIDAGVGGTHPAAPERLPLLGSRPAGRQWAVFDAQWKYTWDEKAGSGALRTTLGDEPADDPRAAARYHLEYLRLQRNSRYGHLGPVGSTPAEQAALEDRLRSLGYL